MDSQEVKAKFAEKLSELCDDMKIPPGRGRQSALAQVFDVSPNAARKWLLGHGLPELELAVRIAEWADVNVNWLLQGVGPKHGTRVDSKALVLDDAVKNFLPRDLALDLLDNIRTKLERTTKLTAREPASRYTVMLDAYEQEITRKPN